MNTQLPYEEEDALKRILRHHQVTITPRLLDHLGQLVNWVRQLEKSKATFNRLDTPMPLVSVLGNIGIYGKEYIDKVEPS